MSDKPELPGAVWTGRILGLCMAALAIMLTVKAGLVLFT